MLSWIAIDDELALEEVAFAAILLAVAGHETTTNLIGTVVAKATGIGIGNGGHHGHDGPRTGGTGPAGVGPAEGNGAQPHGARSAVWVDEAMRLHPPVQAVGRVATRTQHVAGKRIEEGERVGGDRPSGSTRRRRGHVEPVEVDLRAGPAQGPLRRRPSSSELTPTSRPVRRRAPSWRG